MAYDLGTFDTHRRAMTGLDGMDYLLAMEGWYWNALDWMSGSGNWSQDEIFAVAWRATNELSREGAGQHPDNFVAQLTLCLRIAIRDFIEELEENIPTAAAAAEE